MFAGLSDAAWIAIANGFAGLAVILIIKPLNDVKREMAALNGRLYREFVTHERLEERFRDRDVQRFAQQNRDGETQARTFRANRGKDIEG